MTEPFYNSTDYQMSDLYFDNPLQNKLPLPINPFLDNANTGFTAPPPSESSLSSANSSPSDYDVGSNNMAGLDFGFELDETNFSDPNPHPLAQAPLPNTGSLIQQYIDMMDDAFPLNYQYHCQISTSGLPHLNFSHAIPTIQAVKNCTTYRKSIITFIRNRLVSLEKGAVVDSEITEKLDAFFLLKVQIYKKFSTRYLSQLQHPEPSDVTENTYYNMEQLNGLYSQFETLLCSLVSQNGGSLYNGVHSSRCTISVLDDFILEKIFISNTLRLPICPSTPEFSAPVITVSTKTIATPPSVQLNRKVPSKVKKEAAKRRKKPAPEWKKNTKTPIWALRRKPIQPRIQTPEEIAQLTELTNTFMTLSAKPVKPKAVDIPITFDPVSVDDFINFDIYPNTPPSPEHDNGQFPSRDNDPIFSNKLFNSEDEYTNLIVDSNDLTSDNSTNSAHKCPHPDCTYFVEGFKTIQEQKTHVEAFHMNLVSNCVICGVQMKHYNDLIEHMAQEHNDN